ncbi:hypothetical protein SAMN05444365_103164 [Micromonospora pattaloongensis]|uniref:Maltokinase N-terminal cap domain-containing protein n=1 Tax=Micromonospora pattaloongensis TaxID=405436 RepID=A0A1H3LZ95_9ACTN|nr:hypothetical protein [Micromonospora pattaloongensis]SDY69762.1 hypothetical protein SAMN05444365_103164 [Micromonospora pattaloongensis]
MAIIYPATVHPTKLELLAAWLPGRAWFREDTTAGLVRVGSYRFDDPAGEVGIESILVRVGDGPVYQAPLTYRGKPLADADDFLVGTMEHSVLGQRWIYDACGDPVYALAMAAAILAGAGQAEETWEVDGRRERQKPTVAIATTVVRHVEAPAVTAVRHVVDDDPALITADSVELRVVRRLGGLDAPTGNALTGTWDGQPTPVPLAYASLR